MSNRMFVKPAKGLQVRDPQSRQVLPEDGGFVPTNDMFWQRRLVDGDVVEAQAPVEPKSDPLKK